jgi:hypothetical protein
MQEIIQSAVKQVKDLYNVDASSVQIVFEKKGLSFFEGGCTWIDDKRNALVQISPKNIPFYSKQEILAHEFVHALRAHLDENKFEELIAYQTSKNSIRAFLGTLVNSSKEVYLFFISFFLSALYLPLLCLPLILSLLALYRSVKRFLQWHRAKRCLKPYLKPYQKPEFVLFWLKDNEIIRLAKGDSAYAEKLTNIN